jgi:hypothetical protein
MNMNLLAAFLGWSSKTAVTDTLAIFGMLMIMLAPLIYCAAHRRALNERLHTVVDGNKLFEKLRYDLKIKGDLAGIDRMKLYKNQHYARTIFRGAMEYNERDFVWYFNERTAKIIVHDTILKYSWRVFAIWLLFIAVIALGTKEDALLWFWDMRHMNSVSGIVAIWILFLFFALFHGLLKWREYAIVKRTIHDDVRRINLEKKARVWKDFRVIFWSSIATEILGFCFIILNIGF